MTVINLNHIPKPALLWLLYLLTTPPCATLLAHSPRATALLWLLYLTCRRP